MIVGIIRRKPVLTYASIIFGDMLASVNSVNSVKIDVETSLIASMDSAHAQGSEFGLFCMITKRCLFVIFRRVFRCFV